MIPLLRRETLKRVVDSYVICSFTLISFLLLLKCLHTDCITLENTSIIPLPGTLLSTNTLMKMRFNHSKIEYGNKNRHNKVEDPFLITKHNDEDMMKDKYKINRNYGSSNQPRLIDPLSDIKVLNHIKVRLIF